MAGGYTKEEAKEITEKYKNGIYKDYIDDIYYFDVPKKDVPIGVYTPWHDNYSPMIDEPDAE